MLFLYIKIINANIKIVLITVILTYVLLIFPIFIRFNVAYSNEVSKVFYKVKLFNFIVLFYGYVEKIDEGIAIHLNKRKAIIITNDKIFDVGNKIKPLKDYHVIKFNAQIDLGSKENVIAPLSLAYVINFVAQYFEWFLENSKPYVKYNKVINVYEDEELFLLKTNATFVLNLLMITISIIKILVEKTFYAIKNRKQQNQQGN